MSTPLKAIIKYYFIYLAIAISIIVLFKPGGSGPLPFPQADKLVHITTFGLLSIGLWWRGLLSRRKMAVLGLFSYALGSEIIQQLFIPGRGFELLDIAADVLGVLLVLGLAQ